jgi:hypothetical protein
LTVPNKRANFKYYQQCMCLPHIWPNMITELI